MQTSSPTKAYENIRAACGHAQRTKRVLNPRAWEVVRQQVASVECGACFNKAVLDNLPWKVAA